MIKFYTWLYNSLVKPLHDKLYSRILPTLSAEIARQREQLRRTLQAEQYRLAEVAIQNLHKRYGTPKQRLEAQNRRISEDRCLHLKGGRTLPGPYKDYAVRYFTFADNRSDIKCTICGKVWTPKSPEWKDALDMVNQSTNSPASSERTMFIGETTGKTYEKEEVKPEQLRPVTTVGTIAVYQDKLD